VRRAGHLFERVCSFPNLLLAARKAQAAKRHRANVLDFNHRLEAGEAERRRFLETARCFEESPDPAGSERLREELARMILGG
jgi:hypothetical protein